MFDIATRFLFAILTITMLTTTTHAQEVEYAAKEYIADDGTIYWNKSLPIYLRISPEQDGKGVLLQSQDSSYSNPLYLDTEGPNYIRTRYAVDNQTMKRVVPIAEVMMPIIADGSGPVSSIVFKNAERHRSEGIQYYGKNLTVEISSDDQLSGVELLKYKLDEMEFADVSSDLSVQVEGDHVISFYAVDRVGNKETTRSIPFVVDVTAPQITHNVDGDGNPGIIAPPFKISLTADDNLSGVARIFYRFDEEEFRPYIRSSVPFNYLEDGDHFMEYYAVDQVGNESGRFRYDFYFDKTAPLTAHDVLGDRFVVEDRVYFSGRTKMKLTSVDNKIGVREIRYSIDNDDFQVYDQPFYLPSVPGVHRIRYYAVDQLDNRPRSNESYTHDISLVYLDLTGPDITHRLVGPRFETAGVQYISPRTEIQVIGKDPESGLQYLSYSVDGQSAETTYDSGFTISTTGEHQIELFGYDNVNNRNIGSTSVFVDGTPPQIFENFSTQAISIEDGIPLYPPYVRLFLAATDDIVGNDKIYYRINEGNEVLYTKPIGPLKRNETYTVSIRAIDMVGNESTREISFRTAEN